jgi:hypothetical protein
MSPKKPTSDSPWGEMRNLNVRDSSSKREDSKIDVKPPLQSKDEENMSPKKPTSDSPWGEMRNLNVRDSSSKREDSQIDVKPPLQSKDEGAELKITHTKEAVGAFATGRVLDESKQPGNMESEKKVDTVSVNEEEVEYSEEDLQGMSLKDLQSLAEENGIASKGLSKEELVEALFEKLGISEEMEEEILLEDEEEIEEEVIGGEMSLEEAFALLGEDGETEEDLEEIEFEEVEEEVLEGEVEESGTNN